MNLKIEEILMVIVAFLIGWFVRTIISGSSSDMDPVKDVGGKHATANEFANTPWNKKPPDYRNSTCPSELWPDLLRDPEVNGRDFILKWRHKPGYRYATDESWSKVTAGYKCPAGSCMGITKSDNNREGHDIMCKQYCGHTNVDGGCGHHNGYRPILTSSVGDGPMCCPKEIKKFLKPVFTLPDQ